MKKRLSVTLAVAVILCGCASTGSDAAFPGAAGEPVSVSLVTGRELRSRFGQSFRDNPFISPKLAIMAKTDDFIALELKVAAGSGADLEVLQAEAVDGNGNVLATFYNREKFTELAMIMSGPYMDNDAKRNRISWYYLPALKMRVPAGFHSYIMVLVGKHPLPETVMTRVRLSLQGEESSFEVPVKVADAE